VFVAIDASGVTGLWASGRASGTTELLAEFPGAGAVGPVSLGYRALSLVYTAAQPRATLWSTDGTPVGTLPLHSFPQVRQPIFASREAGKGFFLTPESDAATLWSSDGTVAGTVALGRTLSPSAYIVAVSPDLVFVADADRRSQETLTAFDTRAPSDSREIFAFRFPGSNPMNLTAVGSRVIFGAFEDGAASFSLWSSDGTEAGTVRILAGGVPFLSAIGDRGYLFGADASGVVGPFVTDGTAAGTVRLASGVFGQAGFVPLGGLVYFIGNYGDYSDGNLWKTDGTAAGTAPVTSGLHATFPLVSDGVRLYLGHDFSPPWMTVSDGTVAGTFSVLVDIPGAAPVRGCWVPWNGGLVQSGFTSAAGDELWFSDGTSSGTRMVADLLPGPEGSGPCPAVASTKGVFFATGQPSALWITDGTAGGTRVLREGAVNELTVSNGVLFFAASDAEHGQELWKSDGTPEGTVLVLDIAPGPASGTPRNLRDVGGILLFSANDGERGFELWRSDGTASGTFLLQDVNPGPRSSNPSEFTRAGDQIFFSADDGLSGYELWVMPAASLDGTTPPRRTNPRIVPPR
jgi:ELWxxDGT repeat protein